MSQINDATKPVCTVATITPTTIPVPTPSTSSPPTNPTTLEPSLSESNKNPKNSDAPKASDDEEVELDDEVWEDADHGCDDDENGEAIRAARAQASGKVMDIQHDDGVDVSIPQLFDYLSDTPSNALLVPDGVPTNVKKQAPDGIAPKVFEVSDIQF